jgi:hypothetical protein
LVSRWFLVVITVLFGIWLFWSLSGTFETISHYTQDFSSMQSMDFSWSSFTWWTVSLNINKIIRWQKWPFIGRNAEIEIVKSKDSDIHISIENHIRAKDDNSGNKILSELNTLKSYKNDDTISIEVEWNNDFKNTVPLSLLIRKISIELPKGYSLLTNENTYYNYHFINLSYIGSDWEYNASHCNEWIIRFSEKYNRFVCEDK